MSLVLANLILSVAAQAQDGGATAARSAAADTEEVREIARGYYIKSDIGTSILLLTYASPISSGVMTIDLTAGSDFIDNEKNSFSWEVTFSQSLINGPKWDIVPTVLPPEQYIQGDMHIFAGLAAVEASTYVTRRFGIGIRAGGGVMYSPLLIDPAEYEATVVPAWGGVVSAVHNTPLPVVMGGPTIEYYTKLSHFSVGVDIDAQYIIGLNDLAIVPKGYMKYTF